jgi:hypothetical protein
MTWKRRGVTSAGPINYPRVINSRPPLQVTHMAVPEGERLRKLLALRTAQGGLNASDEKELKSLRRRLEMEVLENADVVCSTCVGAGDPRLSNFRFQHVSGTGACESPHEWAVGVREGLARASSSKHSLPRATGPPIRPKPSGKGYGRLCVL